MRLPAGLTLLLAAGLPAQVFTATAGGGFDFDTGVLAGTLRPGGKAIGILPMTHKPTGAALTRSYGLASHYRVFTANHRYGNAAWGWTGEARRLEDGAVEVYWPAAGDRPFEMWVVYRWGGPTELDVETRVRARQDLPGFESFLASYFGEKFRSASAWTKNGFVAAEESAGVWQMFPRDGNSVPLIHDGRWKIAPSPVEWVVRQQLAEPLAVRRDTESGLAAVIMAPREDCFAVAMPHQTEGHYSLYLSLFGRDVKAGRTARAHARLVILEWRGEEVIRKLYRDYLKRVRAGR